MDFKRASAVEVWAGRLVPSRHNTSAPDMVFRDFEVAPSRSAAAQIAMRCPRSGWNVKPR